ncbi:tumor necrosis factor receptor superfamily member 6 isoform X2 [Melanotaenia boesemani]|uniref:tumor necrosis factor receptor superfamily member 6 isoform X2 n=1 Tax=Melanotaenia boesemani TaxID=1250792 RepID=UPI001C0543D2|nr:tumor necrosis factor receptor superfamily member 6 isoform X2 [Melanotaenia boesemani]
MADSFIWFSICCAFFVLFIVNNESLASSSNSSCSDGVDPNDGCCLCPAGQRVKQRCTATSQTVCELCERGTYNAPSSLEKCQPCTSCAHPNANLEEAEACSPGRDTKCRCKKDYFCGSDTEPCKLCHLCTTCGSEGIKQDCNATSDRVCNDENTATNVPIVPIVSVVLVSVLVLIALIVGVGIWRWKTQRKKKSIGDQEQQNESAMEMQDLQVPDVDLEPLVPELSEKLGWTVMKDVAISSKISKIAIDNCVRNHQGNSQEQTCELLGIWIEKVGHGGSRELIRILRKLEKKATADKVLDMLMRNE